MRIVIDMQGAQTTSRLRGIGRYTIDFVKAVIRNSGEHEIFLVLSGQFPESIDYIRSAFNGLLPHENIFVWYAPSLMNEAKIRSNSQQKIAENLREAFLASLMPDIIHITSLFEGFMDDAITSIGEFDQDTPVSVLHFDLIPLINPDHYLKPNPNYKNYYQQKISFLKKSQLLLTISDFSRQEAIKYLEGFAGKIKSVSTAIQGEFKRQIISQDISQALLAKFGISKSFILYTGGCDERKNLSRLIKAFARLNSSLRKNHQLIFVGDMPSNDVEVLKEIAHSVGLESEDLIFTGYVSDEELIQFYNICKLYVFPSWHEGFGLPALEAMACGAPVIGSSNTSLPEVIQLDEALFNPFDVGSITQKIEQALQDENFNERLREHGLRRSKEFSWDKVAQNALSAWIDLVPSVKRALWSDEVSMVRSGHLGHVTRILVLKLDHMGDLILAIPALTSLRSRFPGASIDIVVGNWNVDIAKSLQIFDSIYTLDFFHKKSSEAPEVSLGEIESLVEAMPKYDLAIDFRRHKDSRFILIQIPAQFRVGYSTSINEVDAELDVCIPVTPYESSMAHQLLDLINAIPLNLNNFTEISSTKSNELGRMGAVAVFPYAGSSLREWGVSKYIELLKRLDSDENVKKLGVFVANKGEERIFLSLGLSKLTVFSGLQFIDLAAALKTYEVCVANNSGGAHLASWQGLRVIDIFGGTDSSNEWRPIFGINRVLSVPVPCAPCHLSNRVDCKHNVMCLEKITIEHVHQAVRAELGCGEPLSLEGLQNKLIKSVAKGAKDLTESDLKYLAMCIDRNLPSYGDKQLLVDISDIVHRDGRTGIQRVVRSILKELLINPPAGFIVKPIYASQDHGYRYAREFTKKFLSLSSELVSDEPINYRSGDIFLGLDLEYHVQLANREFLQALCRAGVKMHFVLYDLIPIQFPHFFEAHHAADKLLYSWLSMVTRLGVLICISKSVATELCHWMSKNLIKQTYPFKVEWFHLGSDIASSLPTSGMPPESDDILKTLANSTTFLMVGTLEPRKGHAQALEAFDGLWKKKSDTCLVIVGKPGWMTGELSEKIRKHSEFGLRLFWLEGISDEYLEKIYGVSDCLIAASYVEGFGLPIVEAAKHKIPIIARDIPVFREVAGEHAYYFDSLTPAGLESSIINWLDCYGNGRHIRSDSIKPMSWNESSTQLLQIIFNKGSVNV